MPNRQSTTIDGGGAVVSKEQRVPYACMIPDSFGTVAIGVSPDDSRVMSRQMVACEDIRVTDLECRLQSLASGYEDMSANVMGSVAAGNAVLPVYFDEDCVSGKAVSRYTIWVDVMGSDSAMRRSLAMSANFVMKLHVAALNAARFAGPDFILYPMIDGIYCLATDKFRTFAFIERVFASLANVFIGESKNQHRFMVRGAVAYGPVVRGKDLSDGSRYLEGHADYCEHVVLGMPLTQAFADSRMAAPFGVYVSESARLFGGISTGVHLKWWCTDVVKDRRLAEVARCLKNALGEYYQWCGAHPATLGYELSAIERHEALMNEYFCDVWPHSAAFSGKRPRLARSRQ